MRDVETTLFVTPEPRWRALARSCRPTLRYWAQTEVHVYGFSIAANVLLSFFPFLIVISYLCYRILGYTATRSAMELVLNDSFGDNFVLRNLPMMEGRPELSVLSILLLLFTANGVFEPLEVALNRAWGITRHRSYLKNQLVSLGLIFACGALALCSTVLAGRNAQTYSPDWAFGRAGEIVIFKLAALTVSIVMLFLIYWLLPNAKIDWRAVLPSAVVVGLALEAFRFINLVTFPLWYHKLQTEYRPFKYSALIILWSFLGSMLILAGGEWAARRAAQGRGHDPVRES